MIDFMKWRKNSSTTCKINRKRKKNKFPFICKGCLWNFYLKLKKSNLEINVIKKLS